MGAILWTFQNKLSWKGRLINVQGGIDTYIFLNPVIPLLVREKVPYTVRCHELYDTTVSV
jgi:hypothetical protein